MAVTARIGGSDGPSFVWEIVYDDATRAVTTTATGAGFCLVTVQLTATLSRTVAYIPQPGAVSVRTEFAARMAAADFTVVANGQPVTLASNVNPNQVSRLLGKATATIGGLQSTSEWAST